MSFNELPLDLKIKINILSLGVTTYTHNDNLIYQIPKYNKYGNKTINIFDKNGEYEDDDINLNRIPSIIVSDDSGDSDVEN